jgi:hypothetical protein
MHFAVLKEILRYFKSNDKGCDKDNSQSWAITNILDDIIISKC